ncbi:MAG: MarR family transcriptional regulator [Peptostreptococcaceae bacterium]|nr:MarR family transcriptional regulator [Peptostreptococcaceae bacterium]
MKTTELQLLIGLNRTVNELNRKTAHLCLQHKLTLSQFGVLEALYHKGELTIGQVKELILSSDGTIPVVIKNLEKNNLIQRKAHPSDKRCTLLKITSKGKKLIDEVFPLNVKLIKKEMKIWTADEKKVLLKLLKKFASPDEKKKKI